VKLRRLIGITALTVVAAIGGVAGAASARRVVFEQPGMFGELIVEEDLRGMRYLLFERNGDQQSAGRPNDPGHLEFEYTRLCMAALAARPAPARILMVGLGGGSMPRWLRLHFPEAVIDVVEIDPAVGMVARRFFGFVEDPKLKVAYEDGRAFVERKGEPYDLVLLDAYGSDDVPPHLATVEFFRAVAARLAPGGVVAANLTAPPHNRVFHEMLASFREVFPQLVMLQASVSDNRVVLLRREEPFVRAALVAKGAELTRTMKLRFGLGEAIDAAWIEAPNTGARPLRDGKRPARAAP